MEELYKIVDVRNVLAFIKETHFITSCNIVSHVAVILSDF